jgi:hypothetical protein
MAEQNKVFVWDDPSDGEHYEIPHPTDPRINIEQYVHGVIRAKRAAKAKTATPPPIPKPPLPAGLQAPDPAQDAQLKNTMSSMGVDPVGQRDSLIGALKSLGKTAQGAVQWGVSAAGLKVPPNLSFLEPSNDQQRAGGAVGTGMQMAGLGMATGGLSLPAQVAAGGVGSGLIAASQGDDPTIAAYAGMGVPIAAKAAQGIHQLITSKLPARSLNSLIGAHKRDLDFGFNPGEQLAKEGITAHNKEELLVKVKALTETAGKDISSKLAAASPNTVIDNASDLVMEPLEQAVKGVGAGSERNFQIQLSERMTAIFRVADELKIDLGKPITPAQAHALKVEVGKGIKWTGTPYEGEVNQALAGVYRNLNKAIEAVMPGANIKAMNLRYGNLLRATNALEDTVAKKAVSPVFGASSGGTGVLQTILNKSIGTTPLVTPTSALAGLGQRLDRTLPLAAIGAAQRREQ